MVKAWRGFWSLSMCAALIFFSAATILGQNITAGIRGTVIDSTGAVVADATIDAREVQTGYSRSTGTDSGGGYVFTLLPVGTYEVRVTKAGFKEYTQTGILLSVNQVAGVNVTLEVGAVSEKVQVQAAALTVNTQTSETGTLADARQITELPLNGRNPIQLATLTPGVRSYNNVALYLGDPSGGAATDNIDGGGSVISVNGIRYHQTQFNLDGGEYAAVGFDSGLNYPNPDALQEFRLIVNNYSAEFGRLPGGVMNVVTKSGTNQIHGSAWEFNRNSALGALGYQNTTKPFLNQNQFGFTAGGPVKKDKLFLFGTAQWLKIAQAAVVSGQFLPTAEEKSGNLNSVCPAATLCITNPATGVLYPNNTIPASDMDPLGVALLNLIPLPNQPDGTYYAQGPNPVHNRQYLIKGDYQVTGKNLLAVSVLRDNTGSDYPFGRYGFQYAGITGPDTIGNGGEVTSVIANDTHVFSATLLNQLRFSYTGISGLLGQSAPVHPTMIDLNPNYPQFPGPLDRPAIWITGRAFASRGTWGASDSDDYQIMDNVTYIHGSHNIKFGIEYRNASRGQNSYGNDQGFFWSGKSGTPSGNALSDMMLGITDAQITSPFSTLFYQHSWAGYFQDDYKVNRRLVLNLGLRYQIAPVWTAGLNYKLSDGTLTNGTIIWEQGRQSQLFPNAPAGLLYSGDPGIPRSGSYVDKTNLTPRLGFAWDIFGTGKTSLRGGWGMFNSAPGESIQGSVGLPFGANTLGFLRTPQYVPGDTTGTTGIESFPGTNYYPAPPIDRDMSFDGSLPLSLDSDGNHSYFVGLHPKNARIYQYNLTLEHELTKAVVVSAAYVGNLGRNLPWNRNINPAIYVPGNDPDTGLPLSTEANLNARRPLNAGDPVDGPYTYGTINIFQYTATNRYDSLQAQARSRDYHGLTLQGNYNWSHAIDDSGAGSFYLSAFSNGVQDPNCIKCEKGNSAFDHRHQLIFSYFYRTPSLTKVMGVNNILVRKILDDWGLSGINAFTSGGFGTILSGASDNSLTGTGHDRADLIGDPSLSSGRSLAERKAEYFNTAAFANNAVGTFGNTRPGFLPLPGTWSMDFSFLKHVPFGKEQQREFEFRVEFYNALNHVNLSPPGLQVGSPGFGVAGVGAQPGRIIQLGGKVMF